MADPYTIRIFVPDGDPEGLRIIDRMKLDRPGHCFSPPRNGLRLSNAPIFLNPGLHTSLATSTKTTCQRFTSAKVMSCEPDSKATFKTRIFGQGRRVRVEYFKRWP